MPVSTTSESSTLAHAEYMRLVEMCVGAARSCVPVVAAGYLTRKPVKLTCHAKEVGADAALVVTLVLMQPSDARTDKLAGQ